jgi:hypothetical protein
LLHAKALKEINPAATPELSTSARSGPMVCKTGFVKKLWHGFAANGIGHVSLAVI